MKKELYSISNKSYGLADSKGEFYVNEIFTDGSVHKRLYIKGFDKGTPQNMKLHTGDISWVERMQKEFAEAAPMFTEIFYDSNILTDQQKKTDILSRLVVVEQVIKSGATIRSLNASGIQIAKEESELKKQLSSLMSQVSKNVGTMAIDKCKKIKELLSELN
jgi:hypothetical protein